jgi:hypothetical protein
LLIEAVRGIGAAKNKLTHTHIKADDHNPGSPLPDRGLPVPQCQTSRSAE